MTTKTDMRKEITRDRREFIKNVLGGTIAGSLLLVIPARAGQLIQETPGRRDDAGLFARKKFAFVVDITACIGCGSCCVADKTEYRVPDGRYRTWVERYVVDGRDTVCIDAQTGSLDTYPPARQTLPHPARDIFFVPKVCNMCEKPACVEACPIGASFRTSGGFVLIDENRCIGCSECVRACPYSARFINPWTRTAEKCSWCYHRVKKGLAPVCVSVCPVQARKFGDLTDRNSEVWRILNESLLVSVLKPDMGKKPSLYYIGLRREVV